MPLPNTNISVAMVKSELGAATNDVGRLCVHPNVNMWSKWKPIRHTSIGPITQTQLEAHNYGLVWKYCENIEAVKAAYASNEEVLIYNKPRGGLSEPLRLTDFTNYEKNAIPAIAGAFVTPQVQNIANGQTTIVGSVALNGNPKTGEIGWEDLGFGSRKLAMALYYRDDLVKVAVADNSGDAFVEMDTRSPLPVLEAQLYMAFLFFTNSSGTTTSNLAALPNHAQFGYPVQVVSDQVLVSIEARWSISNPNQIVYSVRGTNQTGSSVSLLNCSIRLRNQSNECSSTIQQHELLLSLGTLTLPTTGGGGAVTIYSDNVTVAREQFSSWKICWSNGGAHPFTTEANIIQEMD